MESNNNSITAALLQLITELEASSAAIASLTSGAVSQDSQLAVLKAEISQLSSVDEEERMRVVKRLEELEAAGLSREDMARAFEEEMKKNLETNTGVLWVWLHQVN